ncbi:MAG: hypothetical protein MJZ11_08480 [Lachnospiraceae bacterium]|nr:hypothetical protein [Lachnospiraceae bacterium]
MDLYLHFGSTTSVTEVAKEMGLPVKCITDCAKGFGYEEDSYDEFQIADIKNKLKLQNLLPTEEQFINCHKRDPRRTVQAQIIYNYLKNLNTPTQPAQIGKYFGIRSVCVLNALMAYPDVAEEDDGSIFIIREELYA